MVISLSDAARYGSVAIEEKTNIITGFAEKQGPAPGYINAGVYCLRRDIFAKYSAPATFSGSSLFSVGNLVGWFGAVERGAKPVQARSRHKRHPSRGAGPCHLFRFALEQASLRALGR